MSDLFVDNIKHQSSQGSGTITLGASGETIALASGASVTGNGLVGITMADQWRLTANTNTSTDADVTTNWERVDTNEWGGIGTGLTESSGIFSFPQTGIYQIIFFARFTLGAGDSTANFRAEITSDNSTFNSAAFASDGTRATSNVSGHGSNVFMLDVTDITNYKFKFLTASFSTGTNLNGSTNDNRTGFICTRLGDT